MIKTRKDLKHYISCDMKSLGINKISFSERIIALFIPKIWRFEVCLRKYEYYFNNRNHNLFLLIIYKLYSVYFQFFSHKMGYYIGPNVIGAGLCLCHIGPIIINKNARIGVNARIHVGVNIGESSHLDSQDEKERKVPIIGNNVYIGPGAKIFGKIVIGDNCAIGANAVVNRSFDESVTIAGVPAVVVSNKGSKGLLIYGETTDASKI